MYPKNIIEKRSGMTQIFENLQKNDSKKTPFFDWYIKKRLKNGCRFLRSRRKIVKKCHPDYHGGTPPRPIQNYPKKEVHFNKIGVKTTL